MRALTYAPTGWLRRPRAAIAIAGTWAVLASAATSAPSGALSEEQALGYSALFGPGVVSDVAVDPRGAAYVVGWSTGQFPTTAGAFDRSGDVSGDAFISKISPDGSRLVYSTFLGGRLADRASSVWVDGRGHVTVAGSTLSANFPTTADGFDRPHAGDWDGFVATLGRDGSELLHSTLLGGSGADIPADMVRHPAGAVFLTGYTNSADLPATTVMSPTARRFGAAFVARIDRSGALGYLTVLGGASLDFGSGIDVDGRGRAFVAGQTSSPRFPTTPGAFDASFNGGSDGFVAALDRAGSDLAFSTFLGGAAADWGSDVAVDPGGRAYVAGYAQSPDYPTTPGAFDVSKGGVADAFVSTLQPGGSTLAWSTFLGGDLDSDSGLAIAIDPRGRASVTGYAGSGDFPTTEGAFDTSANGRDDAFVTTFTGDGSALASSTLLGGSGDDRGRGVALGRGRQPYVVGDTTSTDFPITPGAFGCPSDPASCASSNLFLTKLAPT